MGVQECDGEEDESPARDGFACWRICSFTGPGGCVLLPVQTLLIPIEKFPALNDKGAVLQLWDAAGGKIEEVAYEAATSGVSWERGTSGWHLSTDPRGGTPGAVNSSPDKEEDPPVDPDRPDVPDNPMIPTFRESQN